MINIKEAKDRIHQDKDWQSRALLIEVLHFELMLIRTKWSLRKTAKLLDLCASTVCEDIMLSKFSLRHPEIGQLKLRRDALNYVKRNK